MHFQTKSSNTSQARSGDTPRRMNNCRKEYKSNSSITKFPYLLLSSILNSINLISSPKHPKTKPSQNV